MKGLWTILLLIGSNIFMTIAWYGQLKLSELGKINSNTPLIVVIVLSWLVALLEYSLMVPANRLGSSINGGPFNLMQLKVIQEAVSLTVFTILAMLFFQNQPLHWNHLAAFVCLVLAVFFVFMK